MPAAAAADGWLPSSIRCAGQSRLLLSAGSAVRRGGCRALVVGLAPGRHGANASGRPFTGDHAGILLYATLHAYGFASQPVGAARDDGLALIDCRITNAVKCLPPDNKPIPAEIRACNDYLAADLAALPDGGAILALGRIAHEATLRALGLKPSRTRSVMARVIRSPATALLFDSYHCSRYNTNTRAADRNDVPRGLRPIAAHRHAPGTAAERRRGPKARS